VKLFKMTIFNKISVALDESKYDIIIGRDLLENIASLISNHTKNKQLIIIGDAIFKDSVGLNLKDNLAKGGFHCFEYYITAGKQNKNFKEVLKVFGILEENNFARDSTVISLGGGVIGDLSGFVASTWLRGIKLVHIPTTLLAMVDSSIGGKTAINFRKTINGIGSYHQPIFNLIDLNLVDSISDRDFFSGMAEVLKVAIIDNKEFYNYLLSNHKKIIIRDEECLIECIKTSIEIKIKYVQGDVREGSKRLHLNYGHTIGHALEISTEIDGKEQLRHGEGVSIGIVAAAYIAEKFLKGAVTLDEYINIFKMFKLPVNVKSEELGFKRESLIDDCIMNVNKDKKRINNKLRLILSSKAGSSSVYSDVPFELVEDAFKYIIK